MMQEPGVSELRLLGKVLSLVEVRAHRSCAEHYFLKSSIEKALP